MTVRQPDGTEWVPSPIGEFWIHGKRWKLMRGTVELGRVTQLLPGGLWETHAGLACNPGYETISNAATALLKQLRNAES